MPDLVHITSKWFCLGAAFTFLKPFRNYVHTLMLLRLCVLPLTSCPLLKPAHDIVITMIVVYFLTHDVNFRFRLFIL